MKGKWGWTLVRRQDLAEWADLFEAVSTECEQKVANGEHYDTCDIDDMAGDYAMWAEWNRERSDTTILALWGDIKRHYRRTIKRSK